MRERGKVRERKRERERKRDKGKEVFRVTDKQ